MSWIENAAVKRRSQASTVIVFETCDPKRVSQFLEFTKSTELQNLFRLEAKPRFLVYEPWTGLTDNYGTPVNVEAESPFPVMGPPDLGMVLRQVDGLLKQSTTFLTLVNMAEESTVLRQALRAWATSPELYRVKSTVFVFTPSASTILDDYTKSLVAIIPVPISSVEEREEIVRRVSEPLKMEVEPMLVNSLAGLNLHEAESALLESAFRHRRLDPAFISAFKAEVVRKSGVLSISEPRYGFEAIGGYEETKRFIRTEVINVLAEPERAEAMGLRPPRGILLFGPPGTGKSLFARALAKELRLPFIELRLEDIYRSLVGETEQRLRRAIDIIEAMAPDVVFIDEIDRLGHRTDVSTDSGVSRRVFSALLEWLGDDRRRAIIVGTTNEPEYLDAAMLRAGRLDRKIPLMLPDKAAREAILQVHTNVQRKVPVASDVSFSKLAEATEFWSGAELEELVLRAARRAFNERVSEVSSKHFREALETFNIDLSARQKMVQRYLALAERYCDDRQFLASLKRGAEEFSRAEAVMKELTA